MIQPSSQSLLVIIVIIIASLLRSSQAFLIRGAAPKAFLGSSSSSSRTMTVISTRRQTRLSAKEKTTMSKPSKVQSSSNSSSSNSNNKAQSKIATAAAKKKNKKAIEELSDAVLSSSSSPSSSSSSMLLKEWATHSDPTYHHFSDSDATEIRRALLSWYRSNRRKLPWRGDPPPYDGSTAGINNTNNSQSNNKNNKKKKMAAAAAKKQQPNITSFFTTTTKKQPKPQPTKEEKAETVVEPVESSSLTKTSTAASVIGEAIPISGYGVWVSEIMLQQTRVEAVIPYWIKWMSSFPTVFHLANATEDQVNAHWAGLGFYRRARLLHQGAKHVVAQYDGNLPQTKEELLTITGIGPYTASAIASIAFDVAVPVVDGNVCRVLSRLTGIANHIKSPIVKDKLGWDLAAQLVVQQEQTTAGDDKNDDDDNDGGGQHAAGEVNQALMELGATYCAPSGTGLDDRDPLKEFYLSTKLARAYRQHLEENGSVDDNDWKAKLSGGCTCELCMPNGIELVMEQFQGTITTDMTFEEAAAVGHATFPLDPPKGKKREEDIAVTVIKNTDPETNDIWWLLVKRPNKGLLAGQWEFPSVCVATRDNEKAKPPTLPTRRKSTDKYLQELFEEDIDDMIPAAKVRRGVKPAPLEHIFSHVKHYMWVETCETSAELKLLEWTTRQKKEVRWMRETDMKEVGITSGVKKVLKAVKTQIGAPSKKRKR